MRLPRGIEMRHVRTVEMSPTTAVVEVELILRRWYRWWLYVRALPLVFASIRIERG